MEIVVNKLFKVVNDSKTPRGKKLKWIVIFGAHE
jgi:hypothetical protein